jgi:predicted dehydrogenase
MKVIVLGLGVQGYKRRKVAGKDVVATVDPFNPEATNKSLDEISSDKYDAVLVCTPDDVKIELLKKILSNGKHVLVEKPLITKSDDELLELQKIAKEKNVVCCTAYNHRFEPHFVEMQKLISSNKLGKIYSVRMFYGNGTARLVRDSAWRDQAAGVLPDLGSHLLDTLLFWFGESENLDIHVVKAFTHENNAFDHVVLGNRSRELSIQLEMMLLSWRNHFTCDVFAENGSAHIESLCKWGPSTFTYRERVLPSGRPPESRITLVKDDPTWQLEYDHFSAMCANNDSSDSFKNDIWLNKVLKDLASEAGIQP